MSSAIVGGKYKCTDVNHGEIETDDVNEWNNHCVETGHTESGETACVDCGTGLSYKHIPYHRIRADGTKGITLRCPDCYQKLLDQNIQSSVKKTPNFADIQRQQLADLQNKQKENA